MSKIFISYSRQDILFVNELRQALEANGLDFWLDTEQLIPGTPNWEQSIRDSIKLASVVILIASPASRKSTYVQGELTLAQIHQLPIYPVWVDGTDWIDSIQLGMVNYQYVDCRDSQYEIGITKLVSQMKLLMDTSIGKIKLGLPMHETVELNLAQFDDMLDILDYIYIQYLQDFYPQFSYGREWILGNVDTKQLAVPIMWINQHFDDREAKEIGIEMFPEWHQGWITETYELMNILDGSHWAVWEVQRTKPIALALKNVENKRRLLSPHGKHELDLLIQQGIVRGVEADKFEIETHQLNIVMNFPGHKEKYRLFIEK